MPKTAKWIGDIVEHLLGSKIPVMRVLDTTYINTNIKKVQFKGNLSGMDFQLGYAVAIRVSDTEYRNYTPSFSDTGAGILEIIMHRHSDAPGSTFIDNLRPDQPLRVSVPRGKKMYDPSVKNHIVCGDETSLGLAYAFQTKLLESQKTPYFYFELDEENEAVPGSLGLKNYTIFRKHETFRREELIDKSPIFQTHRWQESNFILTGNAKSVQALRRVIKRKKVTGKILAQAYWAEGKTGL